MYLKKILCILQVTLLLAFFVACNSQDTAIDSSMGNDTSLSLSIIENESIESAADSDVLDYDETAAKEIVISAVRAGEAARFVYAADFPTKSDGQNGFFQVDKDADCPYQEQKEILERINSTEDIEKYFHSIFTDAVAKSILSRLFNNDYAMYMDIDGSLFQNENISPDIFIRYYWDVDTLNIVSVADHQIEAVMAVTDFTGESVGEAIITIEKDEYGQWKLNDSFFYNEQ